MSFHDYIRTRRYQFGRGSKAGWVFIARALGDPCLPDARNWKELRDYLERCGDDPAAVRAAQVVWSSYLALLTKMRGAEPHPRRKAAGYNDGSVFSCSLAR